MKSHRLASARGVEAVSTVFLAGRGWIQVGMGGSAGV